MCDVLDRVENRGRAEGRAEGWDESKLDSVRQLMRSLGLNAEKAMDALAIPEQSRESYRKLLVEQIPD